KTSVQDTASTAVNSINTKATQATEHVDAKVTEFNQTVDDNGFLSPQILDEELGKLNWQKYKLTNDDGSRTYVQGLDLHEAPPGQYESTQTVNGPLKEDGEPDTGFIESDISVSSNGRRLIMATRSSFNKTYIKTLHTNGTDTGWKELTNNQSDTGWIPFTLINGALANDAFKHEGDNGFDCAYRIITNGSVTEKRVRINVKKIVGTQQIAELPEGFAKNVQFHLVRAPIHRGQGLIGIFPSGSVYAYVETDKRDDWKETDYFYGEISWLD